MSACATSWPFYVSFSFEFAQTGFGSAHFHLDSELVPGPNGFPKTSVFHADEKHQLLFPIGNGLEDQESSSLGHRFENQHSR